MWLNYPCSMIFAPMLLEIKSNIHDMHKSYFYIIVNIHSNAYMIIRIFPYEDIHILHQVCFGIFYFHLYVSFSQLFVWFFSNLLMIVPINTFLWLYQFEKSGGHFELLNNQHTFKYLDCQDLKNILLFTFF